MSAVASAGQMIFVADVGGHRAPVASIEDAAAKWEALRDRLGEEGYDNGASAIGNGGRVMVNGREVARISYNGRIWPGPM